MSKRTTLNYDVRRLPLPCRSCCLGTIKIQPIRDGETFLGQRNRPLRQALDSDVPRRAEPKSFESENVQITETVLSLGCVTFKVWDLTNKIKLLSPFTLSSLQSPAVIPGTGSICVSNKVIKWATERDTGELSRQALEMAS